MSAADEMAGNYPRDAASIARHGIGGAEAIFEQNPAFTKSDIFSKKDVQRNNKISFSKSLILRNR